MVTLLVIMSCIVTITESKVKQWLPFGGREYYIGTELVNYEEAEYNCSRLDSRTVAIYNESIEMFLRKTIQKSNIAGNFDELSLNSTDSILIRYP